MKRLLSALTFLFCLVLPSKAQFVLTPIGLTTEDNKGYYVSEFVGKSQKELVDELHIWIGGHFVSPKNVVSSSPSGAQITVNAIAKAVTQLPNRMITCPVDMNFSWQILIKDGKIRFNSPTINSLEFYGSQQQTLYLIRPNLLHDGIFKKDGTLLDKYSKQHIEGFFNEIIEQIYRDITIGYNEDW